MISMAIWKRAICVVESRESSQKSMVWNPAPEAPVSVYLETEESVGRLKSLLSESRDMSKDYGKDLSSSKEARWEISFYFPFYSMQPICWCHLYPGHVFLFNNSIIQT